MNILSLFDGMSCGQIALNRANIEYDNYFASEIDKYAIKVTQKNYPNTIQLGDITQIKGSDLPQIDLLIGGSPCQGFSIAGKQLNFNDERSKLFFEYVRLLKECNPKYFLLENVKMKKEYEKVITEYLGVQPIEINSSLVSAQNRKRLYWMNISIEQPKDKGIFLKDILEKQVDEKYYLGNLKNKTNADVVVKDDLLVGDYRNDEGFRWRGKAKAPTLTSGSKNSGTQYNSLVKLGNIYPSKGQNGNIYGTDGKSPSLSSGSGVLGNGTGSCNAPKILSTNQLTNNNNIRRLTPVECERLQTVPDNYTDGISDTQRYKMLGNGWTVDVIAHILKNIK